jgi:hypothetical protein
MAVLSIRMDEKLKDALSNEAKKQGVSLSEYVKNSLEGKLVDTHILTSERNLKSSTANIENLASVSQKVISEVESNLLLLNESIKNTNYLKELKKLKWILIFISLIFTLISIPVFNFNISYLRALF